MRRIVFVIGALALFAGTAAASTPASGLRGTVYRLPGGACLGGSTCGKQPAAGVTLVFSSSGRSAVRAVTGANGTFSVHLAPGTYAVRTGTAPVLAGVAPNRTTVVRGKMRTVAFIVAGPKIP